MLNRPASNIRFIIHGNQQSKKIILSYSTTASKVSKNEIRRFSPNTGVRIQSEYRKIRTRNNSVFGHFSRSERFTISICTAVSQFNGDPKRRGKHMLKELKQVKHSSTKRTAANKFTGKYKKRCQMLHLLQKKENKSYVPETYSDKVTPDIDFADEKVIQCNVPVVKILVWMMVIYK